MKKKVWKSMVCCASMILSLCMFTMHASAAGTQAPEPDVYQLSFKAGEAYNGNTKADVVRDNNTEDPAAPEIITSSKINRDVAKLNGQSAYVLKGFKDNYPDINALTLEAYFMVESFAAEYVDIISYQNAGGLGIEIENPDADAGTASLTLYLNFNEDRADIVNAAEIEFGTYYHVAVTFGAGKACVYVNGELAESAEYDSSYTFKYPTQGEPTDFVIGGDVNELNLGERIFTGELAVANIYSKALNAEEISAVYQRALNGDAADPDDPTPENPGADPNPGTGDFGLLYTAVPFLSALVALKRKK